MGYAPIVYITGDKPKEEYDDFVRMNKLIPTQFIFDHSLTTSHLEAIRYSLDFMKKYELHKVRVVINSIQLPRAKIDFVSKVPREIKFIPHVVSRKGEKHFKVFVEYLKHSITLLSSFVGMES